MENRTHAKHIVPQVHTRLALLRYYEPKTTQETQTNTKPKKQRRISEILNRITGEVPSPLRVGCVNEEVIQKWYNSLCYNNAHNLKDYATKGLLALFGET